MAFLHPDRHVPRLSTEFLILLSTLLLLLIGLFAYQMLHALPQERAVPQPIVASPNIPVHFSKQQGNTSVTEPALRTVPANTQAPPLQSAVLQLLHGPTATEKEQGYYSEIPVGTELLGIQLEKDRVVINLSREFASGGGSSSMLQRVNELKSTVRPIAGSRDIRIAIEGKPLTVLGGEGLEIN